MYYDDIYHPSNEDVQSVNNESVVSYDSRTSSVRKKQNKAVDESKKADKGYHCVKCIVNHRTIKVEVYDSGSTIGNKIRDPIYGNRLPAKVGSKDEYLFFKVRMAGLNTNSPVTLFYDSPEHYERHFKTTLSVATKQKWVKEHTISVNTDEINNPDTVVF
jgi:hypothetical protein